MTPVSKTATSPADLRGVNLYRVAIVGAASLLGKEIAEVLRDRNFPSIDIRLLDDDESLGQLEAVGDEMTFIQSIRPEQFEHVDFTFFASDPRATRAKWETARDFGNTIIDFSGALEDVPGATVRSSWIEREIGHSMPPQLQPAPVVVAHPAATALALLALRAGKFAKVERLITTVFEPVSEQGQKGIDELQEQTVNLLSFQELPKRIYDAQIAFNMVARYGSESRHSLEGVSRRINRHYRRIAPEAAELSLTTIQAPVFHGHVFSIYLELDKPAVIKDLSDALAGEHVTVTEPADTPTNVSAAGQEDVLVSLRADESRKNGVWIWAAIDNLRVSAATAVECAEAMTSSRPKGQIQ
ncbi:MAG TPA: Asd/ArgC dimerization domain-containing protein [Terriglobales bacterium]|nr:Asd/ArgC dimerization domain-containing protein [Terriglobales bacterium]